MQVFCFFGENGRAACDVRLVGVVGRRSDDGLVFRRVTCHRPFVRTSDSPQFAVSCIRSVVTNEYHSEGCDLTNALY